MPTHRYLKNSPATLRKVSDPEHELLVTLGHLVTKYPPQDSYKLLECKGIYHGPTGIAYLFFHIALSHPDLDTENSSPLDWCSKYLSGKRPEVPIDPDHCGVINEKLAHLALCTALMEDAVGVQRFVALLHNSAIMKPSSGGSCEWLYGRSGALYLLRLMRAFVPACANMIDATIGDLVEAIMEIRERDGGWRWHGKEYIGAVHGSIGIVTQVVLSCGVMASETEDGMQERIMGLIQGILRSLIGKQKGDGNWPPRENSRDEKEDLMQFCHGAPGFIISFQALKDRRLFLETHEMDEAIVKARKAVWEKGLLTKEPGLCHGVAGNALALNGEQREHFLGYTTQEMVKKLQKEGLFKHSSNPWGLYGGVAGRAWGFMELLREKEASSKGYRGFIGYCDV